MSWTESPERRAFLVHAGAWALVCAGLAAWNLSQTPPEGQPMKYWFQWPLFGWGIGVAAHGLGLWLGDREHRSPLLATQEQRGFWVHLFVYLTVCALLVWVDLSTSPGLNWVYWPILGWGAGVAAHAWGVWHGQGGETGGGGQPAPEPRRPETQASPASPARASASAPKGRAAAAGKTPAAKTSRGAKTSGTSRSRSAKKPAKKPASSRSSRTSSRSRSGASRPRGSGRR